MEPENTKRRAEDLIYRFFGMSVRDWVQIALVFFALITAYVKIELLIKSTEYLLKFADNSDSYHSQVHGIVFRQGQPENRNYDLKPIRRLIEDTVNGKKNGGTAYEK